MVMELRVSQHIKPQGLLRATSMKVFLTLTIMLEKNSKYSLNFWMWKEKSRMHFANVHAADEKQWMEDSFFASLHKDWTSFFARRGQDSWV